MLSTTDEWFKFVSNFVKIARYTCLMRKSKRIGYPIGIELIYNELIKIWVAANRMKCTENILSTIEELYNNLKPWIIEVIQFNKFSRLYEGTISDRTLA